MPYQPEPWELAPVVGDTKSDLLGGLTGSGDVMQAAPRQPWESAPIVGDTRSDLLGGLTGSGDFMPRQMEGPPAPPPAPVSYMGQPPHTARDVIQPINLNAVDFGDDPNAALNQFRVRDPSIVGYPQTMDEFEAGTKRFAKPRPLPQTLNVMTSEMYDQMLTTPKAQRPAAVAKWLQQSDYAVDPTDVNYVTQRFDQIDRARGNAPVPKTDLFGHQRSGLTLKQIQDASRQVYDRIAFDNPELGMGGVLAKTEAFLKERGILQPNQRANDILFADQLTTQQIAQQMAEGNNPLENFSAAAMNSMAAFGTGIVGLFSPKTARNMQEDQAGMYGAAQPGLAATAGELVATAAQLAPSMLSGGAGAVGKLGQAVGLMGKVDRAAAMIGPVARIATPILMGGSAAGHERLNVAQAREQGQQISGPQEWTAAILNGAISAAAMSIGQIAATAAAQKIVGGLMPEVAALYGKAADETVTHAVTKAIIENAAISGTAHVASNAVRQQTYQPNTDITEGLGESITSGAVMGGVLGGIGAWARFRDAGSAKEKFQAAVDAAKIAQGGMPDKEARQILGLPPKGPVDADVAKRQYWKQVNVFHPDRPGGDPVAFARAARAYKTVTDRFNAPRTEPITPAEQPTPASEPPVSTREGGFNGSQERQGQGRQEVLNPAAGAGVDVPPAQPPASQTTPIVPENAPIVSVNPENVSQMPSAAEFVARGIASKGAAIIQAGKLGGDVVPDDNGTWAVVKQATERTASQVRVIPLPEQTAATEPSPVAPKSVPAARKPVKLTKVREFTHTAIKNELLAAFHQQDGGGYTADDEAQLEPYANPWTWHGKNYPEEVKNFLIANPKARKFFRLTQDPSQSGGADAAGGLGDRYWQIAQNLSGSNVDRAVEFAKTSQDPKLQYLAWLHENMPRKKDLPAYGTVDPKTLQTGTTLQTHGLEYRVEEPEEGQRVLVDGPGSPEIPVEALDKIPVDRGTLKEPSDSDVPDFGSDLASDAGPSPSQLSTGTQAAGGGTGLYGQPAFEAGAGQQETFGFKQDADAVKAEQQRKRDALAAADRRAAENITGDTETGKMFESSAAPLPDRPTQFSEDVGKSLGGTLPTQQVLKVGTPSDRLQLSGVPNREITITQGVLKKGIAHQVPPDVLADLPRLLADPVMVFQSTAGPNRRVVMTDAKLPDGKHVVTALEIAVNRQGMGEVVDIRSIHPKENAGRFLNWINKGLTKYWNHEKGRAFLQESIPANWERYAEKLALDPGVKSETDINIDPKTPEVKQNSPTPDDARPGKTDSLDSPVHALDAQDVKLRTATAPRISVAPSAGGQPKEISRILSDFAKELGKQVRVGKPSSARAGGTYYPGSSKTVTRWHGDLDITSHEIAHYLDDRFGLVADWAERLEEVTKKAPYTYEPYTVEKAVTPPSPFDDELLGNFSAYGSSKASGPKSSLQYQRAEGVAEWIRAYIVNPKAAVAAAPKFAQHYAETIPARVQQAIRNFSNDVRSWAGLPANEQVLSNIRVKPEQQTIYQKLREAFAEKPWFTTQNWLDKLKVAAQDVLWPVMKGIAYAKELRGDAGDLKPEDDPATLIRLLPGFNDKYTTMLESGLVNGDLKPVQFEGKPLTVQRLLEPFDQSSKETLERDMKDAITLSVSERVIEKAQQFVREVEDQISEAQGKLDEYVDELVAKAALKIHSDPADPTKPNDVYKLEDLPAEHPARKFIEKLRDEKQRQLDRRAETMRRGVQQRISRIAGIGAGIYNDVTQAAASIRELSSDPARLERIREGVKLYRAFADTTLKYMVDQGRLSRSSYMEIKAKNQYYAAFHRIMEEIDPAAAGGQTDRLGTADEPVKKFKGSTRQIENPYVNLLTQAYRIYRESDRNAAMMAFRNLLTTGRGMYGENFQDIDQIGSQAKQGDPNAIKIYVKGELEHWQFEPGIHAALKKFGEVEDATAVARIFQAPGKLIRTAVTHAPGFQFRNMLRDAQERFINSDTGSKPWDILRGFSSDELHKFKLGGGEQFGHYMTNPESYHKDLQRRVDELAGDKNTILMALGKVIDIYKNLSKSSEMVGRMAEFRSAYKQARTELGYDDKNATLYAAMKARDILDFAVAGRIIGGINKYVPFVNARVQGTYRMYRAIKANPRRTISRWAVLVLGTTLLTYAWNASDKETEEEYRQLPTWRRDMFYNFKAGPVWISIPKPYEIGTLAASVERAIDYVRGNKHAFDGHAGNLALQLLPMGDELLAGPFKPLAENMMNRSLFFDRQIVPAYEEKKDLSIRDTSRASRLGQALQWVSEQAHMGVDARYMDNLIQGFGGGTGGLLRDVSDLGRADRQPTRFLSSVTGLVTLPPAYASQDVQFVLKESGRLGDENSPRMRRLQQLLKLQGRAETAAERDTLAREVRAYAATVRDYYEKNADQLLERSQVKAERRAAERAK